jgi:hypothetical protein
MGRFETYAESNFIINLCETEPSDSLSEEYTEWVKIFNIIAKKSDLCIDSKDELINKSKENPRLKRLIKCLSEGGSKLLLNKEHFTKLNSDKRSFLKTETPSPIYCLSKPSTNANNGVFVADSMNYQDKFKKIIREAYSISVNIKKQSQFSWKNLLDNQPPLNSIIIADPYLIKESDFDKNLFQILDILLPNKNLDETFHVTLITGSKAGLSLKQLENKHEKIKEFVGSRISDFKLGIYIVDQGRGDGKMMHDRMLITNYFYLSTGKGFDLFNSDDEIKDDTILQWSAICTSHNLNTMNNELVKLDSYVAKCHNKFPSMPQIFGDKENRLLNITE